MFDGRRMGGLRFETDLAGLFLNDHRLNDHRARATPTWLSLHELEHASLQLERVDAP
ncbi:hypothetical protein [Hymenobacter bucti]|uniref:Uncharacterized protein n=1 Tax=Hymenobacter bucti TaxID=1844114 RepID=A0ABW4R0W9_9BACT